MYDKIPPEKVEPIVEVLESAQPEVKAAEVTNPFSISIRQVSMMKSLIMQNAYVDKQLRAFIEFELLSNAISAHVNVSKDLLEAFTKKLVEEIANPDSEELDECLNKAFDNALGAHQSDFNAEELSSLINHREAILAQSLFKGLNEDRVEEINAILKSKMKASNDNTFNDLIDRRFQQLQNKLPVYPSKKGKEPESSDHKGKKRM